MPYRLDVSGVSGQAFDRLVELGALDAEYSQDGRLAAILPDSVTPPQVARALGVDAVSASPAVGRDAGSVWILGPRPLLVAGLRILPAHYDAEPGAIRLLDETAFGTGLHATTALCLEVLRGLVEPTPPQGVLDVGTGSGVLALAALIMGVREATGVDIDEHALHVAGENGRINGLRDRLRLTRGGPEAVTGTWPLVLANVLAAPLIDMAPMLVRRVGHHGRLVLSGIPVSVEQDVDRAYRHLGMRRLGAESRAGWVALLLGATW